MEVTWGQVWENRKEGNVLFNDALNTFYLRLYGVGHMVKYHSDNEMKTRCHHMGYSFRLTARVLLYAPSHRQDSTYHGFCYTSREALAGTRNSSMHPPHEGSIRRPIAPWANALTTELHLATRLENRVDVTNPRICCLSKLILQPAPCEQVHCHEATGVWLKHITHSRIAQKQETYNLQVFT